MDFETSIDVARAPEEVFAFLDDLRNTPTWNARCVRIEQTSPGERAVGAELHYVYREGRREGEMRGVVTTYERDRALVMTFTDRVLEVVVGFRLEPRGTGTHVVHQVTITPRTLAMRLMSPLIRVASRRQVADETARLGHALA